MKSFLSSCQAFLFHCSSSAQPSPSLSQYMIGYTEPPQYTQPFHYNHSMIQLSFFVKAEALEGERFKIVGSLPQLGEWNPVNALPLQFKKGVWQSRVFETKFGTKFEFKVVRVKKSGEVIWETLPNNSNRKFKPKCASQIQLEWSKPEGKVIPLTRGTFKVRGFPAVMINKQKNQDSKSVKNEVSFDPYRDARDEESGQSSQEEFFLVRRKMSDEIVINSGDLEEIYYNNSALQIFSGLLKKIKLYVISKDFDLERPLHSLIEKQLNQLPLNYVSKWISADSFLGTHSQISSVSTKLKKRSSVFDVGSENVHLQALYSRTSYFMLLDLDTAIQLSNRLAKIPTCLFLPSNAFKKVIECLPQLTSIQLICFDSHTANRQFYEYLKGKAPELAGQETQANSLLTVTIPSVQGIIKELSRLRYQEPVIVNTLGSITQAEGLNIILQENTICVIDVAIIESYPEFASNLISQLNHHSLLVIICEEDLTETVLSLRSEKNVVIVYDNFEKIILEGEEYHPLRKFRENLETIRMKSKLYVQSYGGEIVEKDNAILYYLPEGREDWAVKIENECRNMVKKFKCFKTSCKGTRVKVTWNLAKELRLIRTICEIKYTNFGPLGNFNLVTESKNFKELKEDIRLIIEHKSELFKNPAETKVSYYSFGSNQPSSFTIIPSTTSLS